MKLIFYLVNFILIATTSIFYWNFGILVIGIFGLLLLRLFLSNLSSAAYKMLTYISIVAFVVIFVNYYGLVEKFGIPYYAMDDERFEYNAQIVYANRWYFPEEIPYIYGMTNSKLFLLLLAYFQRIVEYFGSVYHTVQPRVFNLYLWLSICVLTFKMIVSKLDDSTSCRILLFLGLIPNALFISSFVYRDVVSVFFIVLSYWAVFKLYERDGNVEYGYIVVILASLYGEYYVRYQLVYLQLAFFLLSTYFWCKRKNVYFTNHFLYMGITFLFVSLLMGLGVFHEGLDVIEGTMSKYTEYRLNMATGLSNFIYSQPMLPFGVILRFFYGLISPFPGAILAYNYVDEPLYSLLRCIVCIGVIFQIFLIPFLLRSMAKLSEEGLSFFIVVLSVVCTTATFRHFLLFYPFAAMAIASPCSGFLDEGRRKNGIVLMGGCIVVMSILWIILKLV